MNVWEELDLGSNSLNLSQGWDLLIFGPFPLQTAISALQSVLQEDFKASEIEVTFLFLTCIKSWKCVALYILTFLPLPGWCCEERGSSFQSFVDWRNWRAPDCNQRARLIASSLGNCAVIKFQKLRLMDDSVLRGLLF